MESLSTLKRPVERIGVGINYPIEIWGGCMRFLPFLACKTCPNHIQISLPTQARTAPHRTVWPWGGLSGNFLCPSCERLSLYWAEDCQWRRLIENKALPRKSMHWVMYRIDVPCGVGQCPSLIHILAQMPEGKRLEDAKKIAAWIDLNGITCETGHPNRGLPVHRAIRCTALTATPGDDPMEWAK